MILPPATLGMLGGGQLGRFFVAAAHEMGYKVWVLDPDPHSPAGLIADRHLQAGYDDFDALDALAEGCAAVTTEFENVPADHAGLPGQVHPRAPRRLGGGGVPEPHRRKVLPARQRHAARPLRRHPLGRRHRRRRCQPLPGHPQGGPLRLRRQGPGPRRQRRRGPARLPPVQGRALRAGADAEPRLRSLGGAGARRERQDRAASPPAKTAHPRHPRRLHRPGAGLRLPAGFGPGIRRAHRRAPGFHRHAGRRVLRQPRSSWW
jgi:hypothetical protein